MAAVRAVVAMLTGGPVYRSRVVRSRLTSGATMRSTIIGVIRMPEILAMWVNALLHDSELSFSGCFFVEFASASIFTSPPHYALSIRRWACA